MGLTNMASGNSIWRGYDYYKENRVKNIKQISEFEYEGVVKGSGSSYKVHINIEHPRKSRCNCPHADGRQVICKHMIALYYTLFNDEAEKLLKEAAQYEKDEEKRLEKLYDDTHKYIRKMKKEELIEQLEYILNIAPEWVYDRFVRDNNIGYL